MLMENNFATFLVCQGGLPGMSPKIIPKLQPAAPTPCLPVSVPTSEKEEESKEINKSYIVMGHFRGTLP